VTGGTFTGHGAVCGFEFPEKLVKNADENGPTATGALPEVITVRPAWNRDDSRESPTE
jgi:hypothetical protein